MREHLTMLGAMAKTQADLLGFLREPLERALFQQLRFQAPWVDKDAPPPWGDNLEAALVWATYAVQTRNFGLSATKARAAGVTLQFPKTEGGAQEGSRCAC